MFPGLYPIQSNCRVGNPGVITGRRKSMKSIARILATMTIILGVSGSAFAQDAPDMKIDFDTNTEKRRWIPVNDGVMGGLSSGGPAFENGNLVFSGNINTNGGGFSSVRRRLDGAEIAGAQSAQMRIKSDGRAYRLRFRTDVTYRGRRIAFQKPIPATTPGEWETVTVELTNMRASLFGRSLSGAKFVPGDVVETGIILADGQDGPFRLEIDWLRFE